MAREAPHIVLSLMSSSTSAAWPTPTPPPKASPSAPALSSAVPSADKLTNDQVASEFGCIPDTVSAAPPLPAAIGSRAFPTFPAAAARPLFPPEDRHKVLVLATTRPADVGVAASHWSLDDLAYHILKDAHFRDMSRSAVQAASWPMAT